MDQKISPLKARGEFQQRLRQGLVTRPVVFSCDHCGQQISGEMEWSCGYCNYENRRTTLYSLLHKCQKCDREPKSCACPGCGKLIFLDEDRDATHPASKAKKLSKVDLPEDPRAKKRKEHAEHKEALEQELEIAQLDAKLTQVKASGQINKESTAVEKIEKILTEYLGLVLGGELAAEKVRTKLAEDYKDKPELLRKLDEALARKLEDLSL